MSTQSNMTSAKNRRLGKAAAIVLLAAVAGCTPDLELRPPAQNTAQWIQLNHKVSFAPGQVTLSTEEARAIDAFVHRAEIGYGDQVMVGGSAAQALGDQRAAVVVSYLRRHRIPATVSPAVPVAMGANEIAIAVGRYIAVAPTCPEWNTIMSGGGHNAEGNRFGLGLRLVEGRAADRPLGCVTSSALAAQIADPRDLIDGGRVGPADGTFLGLGVNQYRAGAAKETESIATGGGG